MQSENLAKSKPACLRCGVPLKRIRLSDRGMGNLFLQQIEKTAEHLGIRMYHCPQCGKLEFYK